MGTNHGQVENVSKTLNRKHVEICRKVQKRLGLSGGTGKGWRAVGQEVARITGWEPPELVGKGTGKRLILRYAEEVLGFDVRTAPREAIEWPDGPEVPNPQRKDPAPSFYKSPAWRRVRYQALVAHGGRCQCCGSSSAQGKVIHVDHVLPRSLFPHLELELTNLQVLCEDCNLGKSNIDTTDWRER